ncbi:hypothetical protein RCG23_00195 [Neobacillus sp. PS3-34]|uniref:hypothetical protein n=1 Tax=Neobacillus sp. PS3-34 TaxID=3070678 RepID=UPI0027E20A1D|nr:hypothetical protein [Neobacillus sp. PS3-34]WML48613.1 hypothetical protein RCG23_00195 [Neobacillus sp. PS3-34]
MSKNGLESIKKTEIGQANTFAMAFELEKEELDVIDNWVESWIDLNIKKKNFTTAYDSLQNILSLLEGRSLKYLLCRLIKIYDLMWGGVYSGVNFSSLKIRDFIDEAFSSKQVFSPNELTSFLAYLSGTPVNPNSDIFDYIWKIEKQSKFFNSADFLMRNKALKHLLELNSQRGYHHNIKDFKKILGYIKPDNTEIINNLNNYKVNNNQGCYQVISFIFGNLKNRTFEIKKDCINWLDNAVGSSPKKPWMDKLAATQRELSEEELMKITCWILNNKHLEREPSTGWMDDIYKKFQKSSKWYLELK